MRLGWVAALVGGALSCGSPEVFLCESDIECDRGQCEPNGYCSFEDQRCEGGRRYGKHSGELSNECVGGGSTDGGATSVADGGGSGSATSSTGVGESGAGETGAGGTAGGVTGAADTTGTGANIGSTGGDTSDTGPMPSVDPYGPCDSAQDCPVAGSQCMELGSSTETNCVPGCFVREGDCPRPLSGTATAACAKVFCVLQCNDADLVCPDELVCDLESTFCVAP